MEASERRAIESERKRQKRTTEGEVEVSERRENEKEATVECRRGTGGLQKEGK